MTKPQFELGQRIVYTPECQCQHCQRYNGHQGCITDRQFLHDQEQVSQCSDGKIIYTGWSYVFNNNDFCVNESDIRALRPDEKIVVTVIKPVKCWHCGNEGENLVLDLDFLNFPKRTYRIACDNCGAKGGGADTPVDAVLAWNPTAAAHSIIDG